MRRPIALDLLRSVLVAVILALFARTFLVQAFAIPSDSMAPNLQPGDQILVNRFIFTRWGAERSRLLPARPVERGDLVVFRFPQEPRRDFIKRCVALAGDVVEIRDKQLFVNDERIPEEHYVSFLDRRTYPRTLLLPEAFHRRDNFGPIEVRPGELFCLGDNRDRSNDSRFWGGVPHSYVKGRALLIYWSVRPPSPAGDDGTLDGIRSALGSLLTLPHRIRWERLFEPVA